MILSAYMHSLCWTGYLQKTGNKPELIMQKVHKCGKKGLIILTALCANSVVAITEKTQSPGRIIHNIKTNLPIEEPKRTKSFALNLSNIQAFDEISKYKKLSILNKQIEKGNCFISQKQFVSTTVKRV